MIFFSSIGAYCLLETVNASLEKPRRSDLYILNQIVIPPSPCSNADALEHKHNKRGRKKIDEIGSCNKKDIFENCYLISSGDNLPASL